MVDIIDSSVWGRELRSVPPATVLKDIDSFTVHYVGSKTYSVAFDKIAGGIKQIEKSQFNGSPTLSAISYNFLVDRWGRVWEGRGTRFRNAANGAYANNRESFSVCVLVGTDDAKQLDDVLVGLRGLYRFLCGVVGRDLIVQGHRDVRATACPGDDLYRLVQNGSISKKGNVVRISGSNRYETAVKVSQQRFPNGAADVFVASGEDFPDALVAGPLSSGAGPLLLTGSKKLPAVVRQEVQRLKPKRIIVVGGPSAVSDAVVGELESLI